MTNVMKEQVMSSVEGYAKAVQNEAYDKVLKILHSKYDQLYNILYSKEAYNIFVLSTGSRCVNLADKRHAMRMKMDIVLDIMNDVSELRYGKY